MTAEANRDKPTTTSILLFMLLFAIGTGYLASLAYFLKHSTNFIERSGIAAATNAVGGMPAVLPVTYTFDTNSPWSKGLAYGWNAPESWGVWASAATAGVVLPPVPGDHVGPVCVRIRFGSPWEKRRQRLAITVNGQSLGKPLDFSGQGPFEIHGMAPVAGGQPIVIRFHGSTPLIPRAVTDFNMDERMLSFSLLGITIETKC